MQGSASLLCLHFKSPKGKGSPAQRLDRLDDLFNIRHPLSTRKTTSL
jgi:hypothetical protein